MTPVKGHGAGCRKMLSRLLMSEYFVVILSVVYFLVISLIMPSMLYPNNIKNIFSNMWPLFAVAMGQTFVLLLGGIDLSQTSVMAVTSMIGTMLISSRMSPDIFAGSPLWGTLISENGGPLGHSPEAIATLVAIAAMLLAGTLIGLLNGVLIAKFQMPSFMVTLITQMFYSAVAILLTKSQNIMNLPDAFCAIGGDGIGIIPYTFFITVALGALAQFMLSRMMRGRWIYATGANTTAARVSGIPTVKVTVFVYALSGFFAAVSSVLYTGRLMMGRPTLGSDILNDVIGATVIGGTSMFGGKGKISWTLFGVLFYAILSASLTQLRLDSFTINVVKGLVILAAATLDVVRTRMQQRTIPEAAPESKKEAAVNG